LDFYQHAGKMALGSRLRKLSDTLTEDAAKLFALYQVDLEPWWFPIFYVLSQGEALSITGIADIIGQAHPVVSQIVKAMTKHGLTESSKTETDGRVNMVRLSKAGKRLIPALEDQRIDVSRAVEDLLSDMQYDLWKAIEEAEFMLKQKDFYTRVTEKRKARESHSVEIIDYQPEHAKDFKRFNIEWIAKYFTVEPADLKTLDHPEENVINPGGAIVMARYKDDIVGTCALVKIGDEYELAKMAVVPAAQGKNIGRLLGEAIIEKARQRGAKKLLIQSNTALEAAINLYYKLGFKKIVGLPSPYKKCNIQMELEL